MKFHSNRYLYMLEQNHATLFTCTNYLVYLLTKYNNMQFIHLKIAKLNIQTLEGKFRKSGQHNFQRKIKGTCNFALSFIHFLFLLLFLLALFCLLLILPFSISYISTNSFQNVCFSPQLVMLTYIYTLLRVQYKRELTLLGETLVPLYVVGRNKFSSNSIPFKFSYCQKTIYVS